MDTTNKFQCFNADISVDKIYFWKDKEYKPQIFCYYILTSIKISKVYLNDYHRFITVFIGLSAMSQKNIFK